MSAEWTHAVWPGTGRGTVKIIARSGYRVLHIDKLDPDKVSELDFDAVWSGGFPVKSGPHRDFAAEFSGATS